MCIFGLISSMFDPITKLIDQFHTTEPERLEAKGSLLKMQADVMAQAIEIEGRQFEAQAAIIKAEASGDGWLQKSWRPITMLVFVFIVFWDYIISPIFHLVMLPIPPDMWQLLKLGLGGYVIGRSVEKTVPGLVDALQNKVAPGASDKKVSSKK